MSTLAPPHPGPVAPRSRGRRLLVAVVAAAMVLAVVAVAVRVTSGSASSPVGRLIPAADRSTAPELSGQLLDGGTLSTEQYAGQVLVLNFWASWCGPCRAEQAELDGVHTASTGRGVQFLGVNVRDGLGSAQAYARDAAIPYPSLVDSRGDLTLSFRDTPPKGVPSTLVVDRQGRVAARFLSPVTVATLQPLVDQLAAA